MKKQSGFSLVELLIVLVIISIIALIGGNYLLGTKRKISYKTQSVRLQAYTEAQSKYRDRGGRTYGTLKELCQAGLVTDALAQMSADCTAQTAVDNWILVPGDESAYYLKNHYFVTLKFENRPAGETAPVFCVDEKMTVRRSADSSDSCTAASEVFKP